MRVWPSAALKSFGCSLQVNKVSAATPLLSFICYYHDADDHDDDLHDDDGDDHNDDDGDDHDKDDDDGDDDHRIDVLMDIRSHSSSF